MASKNDDGFGKLTNREQNFIAFCDELRAYMEEHKLFPQKHSRLSHKIKYTRKKTNEGTLEDWKRAMFEEVANSRDQYIQEGGRRNRALDLYYYLLLSDKNQKRLF